MNINPSITGFSRRRNVIGKDNNSHQISFRGSEEKDLEFKKDFFGAIKFNQATNTLSLLRKSFNDIPKDKFGKAFSAIQAKVETNFGELGAKEMLQAKMASGALKFAKNLKSVDDVIKEITGISDVVQVLTVEDANKKIEEAKKGNLHGTANMAKKGSILGTDTFCEQMDNQYTGHTPLVMIKLANNKNQVILINQDKIEEKRKQLKDSNFKLGGYALEKLDEGIKNYRAVLTGIGTGWDFDMVANGLGVGSGFPALSASPGLAIAIMIINSCNIIARSLGAVRESTVANTYLENNGVADFKKNMSKDGTAAMLLLGLANKEITGKEIAEATNPDQILLDYDKGKSSAAISSAIPVQNSRGKGVADSVGSIGSYASHS